MVTYIRKGLFVFTGLILFSVFIGKSYAPEPQKFKVFVKVYAEKEDETERIIVESHLKRELRALGVVVIVGEHDDWEWRIAVKIIGDKNIDGTKRTTVTLAATTSKRVPKSYFKNYNFKSPLIPVYNLGPAPSSWSKNNLHVWCISEANSFDNLLKVLHVFP